MPALIRREIATSFAVLLVVAIVLVPIGVAGAPPCWSPPVSAPVADPFREPECRWCPGNRGIEYASPAGLRVTAVATGRVTFAGPVAGSLFVVVRHGDGRRVTYGNLGRTSHEAGDVVARGTTVGWTAGPLHFGLRDGDHYVDPAQFLGRLVHRPWLIPVDGAKPNPPPPPRLTCHRRA